MTSHLLVPSLGISGAVPLLPHITSWHSPEQLQYLRQRFLRCGMVQSAKRCKSKLYTRTYHEGPGRNRDIALLFFNLCGRWREWSIPCSGRFNTEKDQVPILQNAVRDSRPVGTDAENVSPPSGIRSQDVWARSESPYRLRYPGPHSLIKGVQMLRAKR
jgi:hypothetical protein